MIKNELKNTNTYIENLKNRTSLNTLNRQKTVEVEKPSNNNYLFESTKIYNLPVKVK